VGIKISKKLKSKSNKYLLRRLFYGVEEEVGCYAVMGLDTIIIDDNDGAGLLMDTTYSYYCVRIDSLDFIRDFSDTVTVRTLPATSHEYTWDEITIGEWQSWLSDVWGTDENNVYAVGSIRINGEYKSILHYNGTNWVPVENAGGSSIYGFSENDIWIAGGAVFHYDGTVWNQIDAYTNNSQSIPLDTVLFNNSPYHSIWGTSSDNLYFGSGRGNIIHWDGAKAEVVIDAGDYIIRDIHGVSENHIWAVGSDGSRFYDIVLHYDGKNWQIEQNLPYPHIAPTSVFAFNLKENYIVGNRVIFGMQGNFEIFPIQTAIYLKKIRGIAGNDFFVVGSFGLINHYNGLDWHRYDSISEGLLKGIYQTDNKVFIVGEKNGLAQIVIGVKN
jgi:hypothetical protein